MSTLISPSNPSRTHSRRAAALLAGGLTMLVALTGCSQELALNLSTGQCLTLPEDNRVASVGITNCNANHHAEVVGVVPLKAKTLPTQEDLNTKARTECAELFQHYVGQTLERSALELKWLAPSEASWKTGDRSLACLATAPGMQMLSQSVKDSEL